MQNILVIFQATRQHMEGLALALGLGAVQAGANIRLRHLDPSPSDELAHAGYGILRTEDLRWAEGVAILLESAQTRGLESLVDALKEISVDARTMQRWAYVFHPNLELAPISESQQLVQSLLKDADFQQLTDDENPDATPEYMTHIGRRLASLGGGKL
jgi:hypothetical protein